MFSKLQTATIVGIEAVAVGVEVEISGGLPGFSLVGLPVGAVKEGSVRIRAAIANSGFDLGPAHVTVNLAPADLRKEGAAFELPIALGVLGSRQLIALQRPELLVAGELSLDGSVKPIRGALSLAEAARRQGLAGIVVPQANAPEAALVSGIAAYGVESLEQAAAFIAGGRELEAQQPAPLEPEVAAGADFADVHGQAAARRAAEVAAAGGHNLLLFGPPGSGKTMVARRLGSILPPLGEQEAIEVTKIHSVAGLLGDRSLIRTRPLRAPHHTCSSGGLIGGGSFPRPGEVSLAHNGVLFLDELPEFQRACLEALRQPLEERQVTIVRSRQAVTFPAAFMLVAAMNPCPCGYRQSQLRTCVCGEREAQRYLNRISGPLLDRFDLFVPVEPAETRALLEGQANESSAAIRARVSWARQRQRQRFARAGIRCNAQMSSRQLKRYVPLPAAAKEHLARYAEAHQLSARALHRACRVARTLADLEGEQRVDEQHVLLALTMQQGRWVR